MPCRQVVSIDVANTALRLLSVAIGLDLALIPIDAESGRASFGPAVAFALAASELVDLALAERITLLDDRLVVQGRGPVGSALLDQALSWTMERQLEPLSVSQWVAERGPWRIDAYLTALQGAEILHLVPIGRTAAAGKRIEVRNGQRVHAAVDRLAGVIAGGDLLSIEDLAFASLADAAGCARGHLHGREHRRDRKRLRGLSKSACRDQDSDTTALVILCQGIQAIRVHVKRAMRVASGSSRTIDQQIGLTDAGWWAAISYYSDSFPP
jgi:hypothetical protein